MMQRSFGQINSRQVSSTCFTTSESDGVSVLATTGVGVEAVATLEQCGGPSQLMHAQLSLHVRLQPFPGLMIKKERA